MAADRGFHHISNDVLSSWAKFVQSGGGVKVVVKTGGGPVLVGEDEVDIAYDHISPRSKRVVVGKLITNDGILESREN